MEYKSCTVYIIRIDGRFRTRLLRIFSGNLSKNVLRNPPIIYFAHVSKLGGGGTKKKKTSTLTQMKMINNVLFGSFPQFSWPESNPRGQRGVTPKKQRG